MGGAPLLLPTLGPAAEFDGAGAPLPMTTHALSFRSNSLLPVLLSSFADLRGPLPLSAAAGCDFATLIKTGGVEYSDACLAKDAVVWVSYPPDAASLAI
jgi:hypothetical protein